MSKRYPGNFITGNPVALSQTSNNGIWDVTDVSAAVAAGTWQEPDGIYEIPKSLRFRSSASAYLTRTPSTAGNRKTWTFSAWIKRCNVSNGGTAYRSIFVAYSSGNTYSDIAFAGSNGDRLRIYQQTSGADTWYAESNMFFRDPSAWYHIVVEYNNTLSTANDRIKLYVNGQRQSFASYTAPAQSTDYLINSTNVHYINYIPSNTPNDMYMAEANFIDGLALDPSYFGYTNAITNIWQPKKYTGAYGTNGFYLPFSENQTLLNLGRNRAGTNLIQYSQTLDQTGSGAWAGGAASVSANSATAPDGTTTADKVVENSAASSQHYLLGNGNPTTSSFQNSRLTLSVYAKAAGRNFFQLALTDSIIAATGVNFDLANGLVGDRSGDSTAFTNTQGTITAVGNGWYRCTMTTTKGSLNGNAQPVFYLATSTTNASTGYNGDGTSGVLFWGAQLNFGETADNYIATTSSAANNDWTPTNISLTADSTYDSMVDSPTNVFTSATDVGGIVPGNYCTWNPIERPDTSGNAYAISLSNGNLTTTTTGSEGFSNNTTLGTFQIPTTGKWYWEILITNVATAAASRSHVGIMNQTAKNADGADFGYASAAGAYSYAADGQKSASPTHSLTSYGTSYTNGNTIGVAVDSDAGKIWFAKNNTWQASGDPVAGTNAAFTGLNMTGGFQPASGYHLGCTANFGQRPFTYTPPVGYKSLNTTNLQALGTAAVGNAAITPNKWFDINRYAGTGTARDIQNSGFQPDIVMVKKISGTDNFEITDSGRGDNLRMYPNTSEQESAGGISLRPDGFNLLPTFGTDNESGFSYIAWQWKQSPTSGLNIIPYTGTGVARTISHNLGVAPRFMWIKQRDVTNRSWCVYHEGLSNPQSAFYLDSSAAPFAYTAFFNNTAPSSSNFSLGTDASVNQNNSKYIAYLWAEVPGFSKFGSYAGNSSSDGPFIYLGFKPRWILVRHSNLSSGALRDWLIYDSARTLYNGYNYSDTRAGTQAIISGVPYTGSSGYSDSLDFVSNGFKFKNGASPNFNASGETYVYAAFAESPFALNNRAI